MIKNKKPSVKKVSGKDWSGNTKFAENKNSKMLPEIPNYIHVVPVGDVEPHEERYMEGYECKCEPKIEPCNGSVIVIHNSFDGREGIEIVNEILRMSKCYKTGKICKYDCKGLCKDSA